MNETTPACLLDCRAPGPRGPQPRLAVPGWLLCSPCVNRLAWMLHDIPDLFAMLDDVIEPGATGLDSTPRAPGFGSKSPAHDDVIVLRDKRTTAVEEGDPHSAIELLASWADNVRDDLDQPAPIAPVTVVGEARLLSSNLGWIAAQSWVSDFAEELTELHRALRRVTGDRVRTVELGTCQNQRTTSAGVERVCGAALHVTTEDDTAKCRRCGHVWPRQTWLRLSRANPERLADLGITG